MIISILIFLGALITTASFLASSGLPSLDSSSSHELMNSNFNSLVLESGLGSSLCYSPGSSTPGGTWRLPEKLQIVKPLEGSSTLQVWSSLATPHLGNLLDKRPGVQTRVERPVEGIGANVSCSLVNHWQIVQCKLFMHIHLLQNIYLPCRQFSR